VSGWPVLRVATDGRELMVDQPVEVTVGRDDEADLNIPHPRVSRRHLVLRPGRRGWVLEDVGSTNGTFHEGRRVSLLRIDGPLRLRLGDPDDGVELRVESEPDWTGEALAGAPLRLGRAADNDMVIRDPTVSRHHAELLGDPTHGYEIVDRGSRNGTFVNGRRVERARLRPSDRIGIGYHEFRLRRAGPAGGYTLTQSVDRAEWWKLAATLAISVLTVVGAALAFWGAWLGARAVDDDQRAVLETIQVQQQGVGQDTQVRAEASQAAAYRAALAEAKVLEQEADQARRAGRPAAAAELADRARQEETLARRLGKFFPVDALKGEGPRARFQVEDRRQVLAGDTPQAQEVAQLDPNRTAAQAGQARRRGVRLQAWSVALVLVLALLTFARLSEPVRPWLMVTGMLLLVAVAGAAVLTTLF
jgi:pSer/pThr/pTyr-binding forkhead associated (FHA) protein